MSRARSALDAMSRIESSPTRRPPSPDAPVAFISFNEAKLPVLFACFVRDAFDFRNESLLLIVEDIKYYDAPAHLLIPALHREDLVAYLRDELQLAPDEIDRLIAFARGQERQYNARAKAMKPPEPSRIPDVTDDQANPPPSAAVRAALLAEAQCLEARKQARKQEKK